MDYLVYRKKSRGVTSQKSLTLTQVKGKVSELHMMSYEGKASSLGLRVVECCFSGKAASEHAPCLASHKNSSAQNTASVAGFPLCFLAKWPTFETPYNKSIAKTLLKGRTQGPLYHFRN